MIAVQYLLQVDGTSESEMSKKKFNSTCLVALASLVSIGLLLIFFRGKTASLSEAELLVFYGQVEPGILSVDVERAFLTNNFTRLKLKTVMEDRMLVQTPVEWGAVNWVLLIESKNGRVQAVRVRLQDSFTMRPENAPHDKVLPLEP